MDGGDLIDQIYDWLIDFDDMIDWLTEIIWWIKYMIEWWMVVIC